MTHSASTGDAATDAPAGHPRLRRTLKWLAIVVTLLLVAGAATGFYLYQRLEGNISVGDYINDEFLGTERPTKVATHAPDEKEPLNILVMGSDTRAGQGKGYGSETAITGARSDTTLLVHLPADRESATRGQHPARHDRRRSLVQDRHGHVLPLHRPVQLRVLDRWSRLHDQDR